MQNNNSPLIFIIIMVLGIVVFFKFLPIIIVIGVILYFLSKKGRAQNSEKVKEIERNQAENIAKLAGFVLSEQGRKSSNDIARARFAYNEILKSVFTDDYSSCADYIETAVNSKIDITFVLQELRNSFQYGVTRLNAINTIRALAMIYAHTINGKGDQKFIASMIAIGQGLGLPHQITIMTILQFCDTGASDDYFAGSSGSYGGYYSNYGGGYGGGQNQSQANTHNLEEAYSILGVDPNCTKDELRKAKKKLLIQWHPDKAPKGEEEAYTEMSQRVNSAYDLIMEHKGWS